MSGETEDSFGTAWFATIQAKNEQNIIAVDSSEQIGGDELDEDTLRPSTLIEQDSENLDADPGQRGKRSGEEINPSY